jgi:hypothetical protein
MKKLKSVITIALAFLSGYMGLKGLGIFITTSDVVKGSEFGMLVTLVNQISLLMLWLSLFAFWRLAPSGESGVSES